MRSYDPQCPLIFIHVPKSAGTSVKTVFNTWFGERFHAHYIRQEANTVPPDQLGAKSCVYGHFNKNEGHHVEYLYPSVDQFISIIREPFEAMVSRYYFVRKVAVDWPTPPPPITHTLPEFLRTQQVNMLRHLPYDLSLNNYQQRLNQHFIHLGVTEHLQASIECIAQKLGQPAPANIERLNVWTSQLSLDSL